MDTTPAAPLLLRPARLTEAAVLAEMSRDFIEHGLAWRYTPLRMARLTRNRETTVLVASDEAAGAIHGFAVMQFGETHGHLSLLCVQPMHRHRGIGRRLVAWLTASAQVAGLQEIRLELRADNASALAFYRRLGFVETEMAAGYYDGQVAARGMVLRWGLASP